MNSVYLIIGFVILLITIIVSYGAGWKIGENETLKRLFKKHIISEKNYNKLKEHKI